MQAKEFEKGESPVTPAHPIRQPAPRAIGSDSGPIRPDSEPGMNPRLFAIAGPLEGAFFALPAGEITIGSDPSNLLVIDDPSVAPRHCVIEGRDAEYGVRGLGAAGRLMVNGRPVRERTLLHGDELRVGDCLFLYLIYEGETPPLLRLRREFEGEDLHPPGPLGPIEHEMVGDSAAMQAVYELIAKVAWADSNVLLLGESGTGKELAARAIHRNGRRAAGPFVAVNCAALTDTLLESELFGYEKGAFTGALTEKRGKLEAADGGTLLLDEIGELAPGLQAKLLRVLQEREFHRVGGTRPVRVDLRVVAASNRDLAEAVSRGAFRPDLYYRLNVVSLRMPPLRERKEDILPLAEYFAARFAARGARTLLGFSPEARELLLAYDWPGNVRELENAVERAVILGTGEWIRPGDLPEAILAAPAAQGGYQCSVLEARRRAVLGALEQAQGNYAEAARLLGIHPNNLHRLIRNLGLRTAVNRNRGGLPNGGP